MKGAIKRPKSQRTKPPRSAVVPVLPPELWAAIVSNLLPHERAALCSTCSTSRTAVFEHATLAPDGTVRFAKEQADAWVKAAVLGGSIFLTGGAGTGKTHVTRQIVEAALERDKAEAKAEAEAARAWEESRRLLEEEEETNTQDFHHLDSEEEHRHPSIAVVTPTGAAARVASTSELRASTVHRLFNIRSVKRAPGSKPVVVLKDENDDRVHFRDGDDEEDAHLDEDATEEDIEPGCLPTSVLDKYTRGVLCALCTLVIDEVSMIDSDMLGTIDCALRHATGCSSPFGGVQIVAVGDFFQLAPVNKKGGPIKWAFTSPLWRALIPVPLTEVHRQKDARFAGLLNRVRDGSATQADVNWFRSRAVGIGTAPLTIMPFNPRCDAVNARALNGITGPVITLEPHRFCEVMLSKDEGGPVRVPDHQLPRTPLYSKKTTAETVAVKVGGRVRVTRNVYQGVPPSRPPCAPSRPPTLVPASPRLRVPTRGRLSPQERIHIARSWPPTGSEARSSVWTPVWSWSTSTQSPMATLQSASSSSALPTAASRASAHSKARRCGP
jgi:hypothetical protein